MERAPGTNRGYYLSKGAENKLANKSLGADKSRLKAAGISNIFWIGIQIFFLLL